MPMQIVSIILKFINKCKASKQCTHDFISSKDPRFNTDCIICQRQAEQVLRFNKSLNSIKHLQHS